MRGSTRHSFNSVNLAKKSRLNLFVAEYSRVVLLALDHLWDKGYNDFSVQNNRLSLSSMLDYKVFGIQTSLSCRALQCAVNQAGGVVRAVIEKQRRRFWVQENKGITLKKLNYVKPGISEIYPELNSNCVDYHITKDSRFAGFARLKCLGKSFGTINLPIDKTSQYNKWFGRKAKMGDGIKIFKHGFQLSWDWQRTPAPRGDKILALDQGLKSVATLSDGQVSLNACPHNHSLDSILDKLSRKKKGSKAFSKAQTHRKNFVHWSVNQLNFSGVKELRLEKVTNIRHGKRSNRKLSHWSNPEIRDKIIRRCEELEVPVVEQSCAYRSQRCNQCGSVRKSNRKGKVYSCKNCGHVCDADLNAALNHEADLKPIPWAILGQKLNLGDGFFWKPSGLFKFDGSELIVPNS